MTPYLIRSFDFDGDAFRLFKAVAGGPRAFFLDSSQVGLPGGRYSFIGVDPYDAFVKDGTDAFVRLRERFHGHAAGGEAAFSSALTPFVAGAAGCLSYDLGLGFEKIALRARDDLGLPGATFGFYDRILTVDHVAGKLHVTSTGLPEKSAGLRARRAAERMKAIMRRIMPVLDATAVEAGHGNGKKSPLSGPVKLHGNFTRQQYERAVAKALDHIGRGDIYQVNLSQRFTFDIGPDPDALALYHALRAGSPVPFGGYFDGGDFKLLSNSPERFLRVDGRHVETRPMKGTRPRGRDPLEDRRMREELALSAKEKAELLMITDLLRNDLGRVCTYGSVRVKEMRAIEEYAYVYQATSTVEGDLAGGRDRFDLLTACFPGGSVTGCPKIRAMEIIEELEPTRRGLYTGAMGYIGFGGQMDFNILIRTLLLCQGKAHFQVGGGIVADSTPSREYEETLVKARALQAALADLGQPRAHARGCPRLTGAVAHGSRAA